MLACKAALLIQSRPLSLLTRKTSGPAPPLSSPPLPCPVGRTAPRCLLHLHAGALPVHARSARGPVRLGATLRPVWGAHTHRGLGAAEGPRGAAGRGAREHRRAGGTAQKAPQRHPKPEARGRPHAPREVSPPRPSLPVRTSSQEPHCLCN